jgi:hypothetical protein
VTRDWLAMTALALACAGLAYVTTRTPLPALAVAAVAVATGRAVRGFIAGTPAASLIAAACAGVLATACFVAFGGGPPVRAVLASACAMFAVGELARGVGSSLAEARGPRSEVHLASPWPMLAAAVLAAALDPTFTPLVGIAGSASRRMPDDGRDVIVARRIALGVSAVGVLATGFAVLAACAHHGVLAEAWQGWVGASATTRGALAIAARLGDELGPLAAVAALAGLAICASRDRLASLATLAITAGAVLVAVRVGAVTPATFVVASLAAGVAVGRLAALVRRPVGQAFVAATAAVLTIGAPAWTLVVR